MSGGIHERFDQEDEVIGPSNRRFGMTLGIIAALIAAWKGYHTSVWTFFWALGAAIFIALAIARDAALGPLNAAWLKLGLLLYRVVNPIIMAVLFYGAILPTGLILRLRKKDLLRLKWDRAAKSYWLSRDDSRSLQQSMRQQF